jgi:hypothetical protein
MKKCPNCSKELPDYATKCRFCKFQIDNVPSKRCPFCENYVPANIKKCPCGFRFEPEDPEAIAEEKKKKALEKAENDKKKKDQFITGKYSFFWIILLVLVSIFFLAKCGATDTETEYEHLLGNVWSNVKVYMGESKSYQFIILGASNNKCSFGDGLLVEFPSGSIEWKSRSALVQNENLYVKTNDPALEAEKYNTFLCSE